MALRDWCEWCVNIFANKSERLSRRVQQMDERHREVRHELKNVQAHADYLKSLVEGMREEDAVRFVRRRREE
jgi:hypothetical protein